MNICARLKAQNGLVLNEALISLRGTKLKCNLTCHSQTGFFLFLFIFGEVMLLCSVV